MSRVEAFETASSVPVDVIDAGGAAPVVVVPDAQLLFTGQFRKVGADLVIEGQGHRVLLQDYFQHDAAPALMAPDGGRLSADTVRALSGLDSQWDFAQAGGGGAPLQIGTVRTLTGGATAQRGGSVQTLAIGDPVFRGDVIETAASSAVGITLVDRTVFSLSAGARMVMNELVYDPARTDNSLAVNLVQGSFVFITGQVAKSGSVAVTTPVATMGIRGTTPIVKIDAILGQGDFSLGADPDGTVGRYELISVITGQIITSVSTTDIVVRIRSAAGPFEILNKTPGDQALDTQLLQPAYVLYQLLGQRGEGTGKGQGLTQLAFNPDALADLVLTPLLNDTSLKQFDSDFFGRPRQFDVLLNADGTVTVVETPRGSLLVDLDPSSDARDSTVTFRENGASLQVAGGVQIAVPTGVTTLTSATVVLTNNQPGDEIIVGSLPAGISVTITSGSIHVNLSGTASVADYIAAIRAIQFVNNSDNPSTEERIVTVTVTLPTGETSTATTTIVIVAVNDAPQNAVPDAQTVAEDGSITFSHANGNAITVSDADSGSQSLTVTLSAQHGALFVGSSAGVTVSGQGTSTLIVTGTAAAINAALDGLVYQPSADYGGADSLVVSTSDNGNTGEGGVLVTTSPGISITVTPVNDAPVNHLPETITGHEDTPLVFSTGNGNAITVSDVDAGSGMITVTVSIDDPHAKLVLGSTAGVTVTGNCTDSVTITGTVAAVNAALDGMSYKAPAEFSGTRTLTITTTDNGNSGAGGPLTDIDTRTITIQPVNDAPVNSVPGAQTVAEDGMLVLSSAYYCDNAITVSDIDAGSGTLTVTLTAGHGTLTAGSTSGVTITGSGTSTLVITGTVADVNAALDGTTYRPTADYNGDDTITVATSDNGNTGTGGAQTTTSTIAVTVTPVNDAPVNHAPATVEGYEDVAITFSSANGNAITISDADAGSGTVTVRLFTGHEGSTLTLGSTTGVTVSGNGGEIVTVTGTLAAVNAALDGLVYQPDANYDGTDSIDIQTSDNGNSGAGGALTDSDGIAITLAPTNDAPVNHLPTGPQNTDDFGLITFSSASYNAITVSDIDGEDGDLTVTLTVQHGTLRIADFSGVDVTGDYTSSVTLTGSVEEINAALDGLEYTSNPGYCHAPDALTITTDDNGNTGAGGPKTDADVLVINLDYNLGPVANADYELVRASETDTVSGMVLANDSDGNGDAVRLTGISSAAGGTASVGAAAVEIDGAFGTLSIDETGAYTYTLTTSIAADTTETETFTYTVTDPYGATSTATLTIDLRGNYTPTAVADGNFLETGDTFLIGGNVLDNDSDSDGDALRVTTITNSSSVSQSVGTSGATVIAGAYGTLTIDSTGGYSYDETVSVPHDDYLTETFTYTISDGKGGTATATLSIVLHGNSRPVAVTDTAPDLVEAGGTDNGDAGTSMVTGNVLDNDSDADGDGLYTIPLDLVLYDYTGNVYGQYTIDDAGNYTLTIDNDSAVIQSLAGGSSTSTSVYYIVYDEHGSGSYGLLDFTVVGANDAPVGVDDAQRVGAEHSLFNPYEGNVLANDSDVDSGALLMVSAVESGAGGLQDVTTAGFAEIDGDHGTLTIYSDGSYSYQAFSAGQDGEDVFTYTVFDGELSDTATLTFNVYAYAGPPAAHDDTTAPCDNAVEAGAAAGADANGNVLTNDATFDPDATELVVTGIRTAGGAVGAVGSVLHGNYGTLVIEADGSYTYVVDNSNTEVDALQDGEDLVDSFVYTVAEVYDSGTDEPGLTSTARLDVTIEGQNDAPRVATVTTVLTEDESHPALTIDLDGGVSDPEGDSFTISDVGVTATLNGTTAVTVD